MMEIYEKTKETKIKNMAVGDLTLFKCFNGRQRNENRMLNFEKVYGKRGVLCHRE